MCSSDLEGPVHALALPGEQPARGRQQRQRERQAVEEHAQFHPALLGGHLLAALALDGVQALLRGLRALARVQQRLLLRLHGLLRLALAGLERIERAGARDHLWVVLGSLRGAARGQPVGKALALGQGLAARLGVLQPGLLQRRLRVLLGLARIEADAPSDMPGIVEEDDDALADFRL